MGKLIPIMRHISLIAAVLLLFGLHMGDSNREAVVGSLVAAERDAPDWNNHPINGWVRQSPREGAPVPNFPYEGSGDYEPFQRKWIHHAGHDGIPQGFHTFTFDLDTARWEQLFPPTSPPGVCCVDGTNAFDVANRRFVRFPGGSLGHGYQWSRGVHLKESPVWLFDLPSNSWRNMRPPPYKLPEKYSPLTVGGLDSGATFVPTHEVTLTFGGQSSGGGKNTLFAYDAYANALHHLKADNPPPARDGMGLAYDTRHDQLVMFGSQYSTDERTWLYDFRTNRWEGLMLDPHPPGQKVTKDYSTIPRLAYDSVNGVVLCLAWLGETGHETWAFDVGQRQWSKLNPTVEPDPSKSRSRNLGFDAARNLFVLESSGAKSNKPEIWTYRSRPAALDSRPAPPTDVEVVTQEGGKAILTWKPTASPGVREYEVHRAQADEPWRTEFVRIGVTNATRFEDQALETSRVYSYVVKSVGENGLSPPSFRARTQPRVLIQPVVSVLAKDTVEIAWPKHPAADVVGYNLYRGVAHVRTVRKGSPKAWSDNDPEYSEPQVVQVRDITSLHKLNAQPLVATTFTDRVDLTAKGPEAEDYRYAVHAYIVRAINRLGTESGPSPYALTIPSEPLNVFCREHDDVAELKWNPAAEKAVTGYHIYKLEGTWSLRRITEQPVTETTFQFPVGRNETRFWIVTVDALGQEGQPSSPVWFNHSFRGFYQGEWHQ